MSQDITSALAKAKFNETLQVSVTPDADDGQPSEPRELLLAASLDKENGGIKWEDVSAAEDPIERYLRTKIWIFPMLNDEHRNSLYEKAIKRAAADVGRELKNRPDVPTVHSLDIGSGTGLLAMMSAKYLKKDLETSTSDKAVNIPTIKVTSIEMSSPMAKLAKQTIASNGFTTESSTADSSPSVSIDVVEGHSCEIPPIDGPKAVLCTSELLESGLLGEGWLPAMRNAWERHLDPRAIVVPQRARVLAQVVEGVSNYWGPQHTLKGFSKDDDVLRLFTTSDDSGTLSDDTSGLIVPVHVENLLNESEKGVRVLTDPMEVMDFDFTRKDNLPGPEGRSITKRFVPTDAGRAEGVLFWWELDLYGKGENDRLTYSTKHGEASLWQDHWHQCLYVFPKLVRDCHVMELDRSYQLIASHTDMRIDFKIEDNLADGVPRESKRARSTAVEEDSLFNPQRCWALNSNERLKTVQKSIVNALDGIGDDNANVLDISDFSLCGMMASLFGARHVTCVEASSSQLPMASARVAQIANCLPRDGYNFQIVQCHLEQLTIDVLGMGKPANLVVAEPYFHVLEENHCVEEAFNLFFLITMLKRNKVVADDAMCVPTGARILACGMECLDLFKAYSKCPDDLVAGLDHKAVTDCWSFDNHPVSLPLYQCKFRRLTKPVSVATLDYTNTNQKRNDGMIEAEFTEKDGTCHAISFWVDYDLGNFEHLDSSDARWRYKQQVLILPEPVVYKEGTPLTIPVEWISKISR